jgi:hypothetical protein
VYGEPKGFRHGFTQAKENTMAIVVRTIHHVRFGQWKEAMELEKKWAASEARRGLPPKRYYRSIAGSEDNHTFVWEQEWESLAAMEAAHQSSPDDSETRALLAKTFEVYSSVRSEIYFVLPGV